MRTAAALHTHADVRGVKGVEIRKVILKDEASDARYLPSSTLILDPSDSAIVGDTVSVSRLRDPNVVGPGDVLRIQEGSSLVSVIYRRGANANTLFVTERCNSSCLMCSQPPRDDDDTWRVTELAQAIQLIDADLPHLGFTGGEPTLLGSRFAGLLSLCGHALPDTELHVLTNGRLLAERALAMDLASAGGDRTTWAVPLYADVASRHDEIVDAPGAFDETLAGLYELARVNARVEIRVVLHALSIPRLRQLAAYIYRRLPFASHVALMGLEPMGFARKNRERLYIDPLDYQAALSDAAHYLAVRGMRVSIYNTPLCVLPQHLWQFARASISDWKNVSDPACDSCAVQENCSGFFRSAGPGWRSRGISPLAGAIPHELA